MNWSSEVPVETTTSFDPTDAVRVSSRGEIASVDIRKLATGTLLVVRTKNSTYRLTVHNGIRQEGVVQGGRLFPDEVFAQIHGSTFGGSQLCTGLIRTGFFLELSVGGSRIVTSRIQSIEMHVPPL